MSGGWLLVIYVVGPVLMALGAAPGAPDRHWKRMALGIVLVMVAGAAALVAPAPTATFFTINNALLWGGLALAGWGAAGTWPIHRGASSVVLAGIAVTLLVTHSLLELGSIITSALVGCVVMLVLGWLARGVPAAAPRAARPARIPPFAWVVMALLGIPALWLMVTIAGPGAMSIEGWREAPFSEAAETLLAALLLPLTVLLSGGWGPGTRTGGLATRMLAGTRYALLGASLLMGVILPLLPDGMLHWRSAYALLLLVIGLAASAGAAWPELVALGSLYASAIGGIGNWPASLVMATAASVLAGPGAAWSVIGRRMILLVAAIAGIAAYPSALGSEVVYSVVLALVVMLAILRTPAGATQ